MIDMTGGDTSDSEKVTIVVSVSLQSKEDMCNQDGEICCQGEANLKVHTGGSV